MVVNVIVTPNAVFVDILYPKNSIIIGVDSQEIRKPDAVFAPASIAEKSLDCIG